MSHEATGELPVAVDAMGGDRAPEAIVAGARLAAERYGIPLVLVGRPEELGDTGGLDVLPASEVIGMEEDPGQGVRRKKDSSLVRAAELVRDGKACATVSAGNTGAAMASALLRMGRLRGISRPAIATPFPNLGTTPTVFLDSGANAECTSLMLEQFAVMGSAYATTRYGIAKPTVALLSIGEEKSKGTPLVKETHQRLLLSPGLTFIGNVEGRDLLRGAADVVVTDGFTGNVTLKSLEGAVKFFMDMLLTVFSVDEATAAAAKVLSPHLAPYAEAFNPDNTGGAMLLGVDGVCVISHGSSSPEAMVSAIKVAYDLSQNHLVARLDEAVAAMTPITAEQPPEDRRLGDRRRGERGTSDDA
jgi:glycerol-3-phosphate acyltransferase PlsX